MSFLHRPVAVDLLQFLLHVSDSIWYCFAFNQLYSASTWVKRSEALPVCQWNNTGFEKGKGWRKSAWKKSRAYRRRKCIL